jgi:hypothetical protein
MLTTSTNSILTKHCLASIGLMLQQLTFSTTAPQAVFWQAHALLSLKLDLMQNTAARALHGQIHNRINIHCCWSWGAPEVVMTSSSMKKILTSISYFVGWGALQDYLETQKQER